MSIKQSSNRISVTRLRQQGVVSITVTMILMVVLSLLVLGFAQVSRRNQRQALDQQLSTQAFYAAESGINAARDAIKAVGGVGVPAKTSCTSGAGIFASLNGQIKSADSGVSYSCLLVNPAPGSLTFSSIDDKSTVIPINAASGSLTSIKLVWKSSRANPLSGCGAPSSRPFTPSASWTCGYGLLRFDLARVDNSMDVEELSNSTMTTFAMPTTGGDNAMAFAPGSANDVKDVKCTPAPEECSLTVTVPAHPSFYLRVKSLYHPVSLEISGKNAGGGNVGLTGAQALVDSTGKARDVLRRIQVRIPLAGASKNQGSDYAIQTRDSLCKRFSVMTGYFSIDSSVNEYANAASGGNPLCNAVTVSDPPGPPIAGAADLTGCSDGCDDAAGDDKIPKTWRRYFTNKSVNASKVENCTWEWGYAGKTSTNYACQFNEVAMHDYPEIDACISYTVKLTLKLANGLTPSKEYKTYAPHGKGTAGC